MKVQTNSWHYKVVTAFGATEAPNSLCEYFWTLALRLLTPVAILMVLVAVAFLLYGIGGELVTWATSDGKTADMVYGVSRSSYFTWHSQIFVHELTVVFPVALSFLLLAGVVFLQVDLGDEIHECQKFLVLFMIGIPIALDLLTGPWVSNYALEMRLSATSAMVCAAIIAYAVSVSLLNAFINGLRNPGEVSDKIAVFSLPVAILGVLCRVVFLVLEEPLLYGIRNTSDLLAVVLATCAAVLIVYLALVASLHALVGLAMLLKMGANRLRRRVRKPRTEMSDNVPATARSLVIERIRAAKEGVCPRLEFVD